MNTLNSYTPYDIHSWRSVRKSRR